MLGNIASECCDMIYPIIFFHLCPSLGKSLQARGSLASKIGMPKVSKQVALAFARRTLARCKKYEDCGVSCFNEPALRDIIFAPPQIIEAEPLAGGGLAGAKPKLLYSRNVIQSKCY